MTKPKNTCCNSQRSLWQYRQRLVRKLSGHGVRICDCGVKNCETCFFEFDQEATLFFGVEHRDNDGTYIQMFVCGVEALGPVLVRIASIPLPPVVSGLSLDWTTMHPLDGPVPWRLEI